jgi:hypothetical protein
MTDAPPTTVEDMFVQTASGVRTDGGTMTLLGLTRTRSTSPTVPNASSAT